MVLAGQGVILHNRFLDNSSFSSDITAAKAEQISKQLLMVQMSVCICWSKFCGNVKSDIKSALFIAELNLFSIA